MSRRAYAGAGVLLAMVACIFPTDSCACVYPPPAAKAFGFVRDAADAPVAGAIVRVSASRAPCDPASPTSPFTVEVASRADGRYDAVAHAPAAGSTCLVVRATSVGGASASATAVVRSRMDSREEFLDSVRVDVQLAAGSPARKAELGR